jgi:hypothetical protein
MCKRAIFLALGVALGACAQQNPPPPVPIGEALAVTVSPATGADSITVEVRNTSGKSITAFCVDIVWHYATAQELPDDRCSDLALGLGADAVPEVTRNGPEKTFRPLENQTLRFIARRSADGLQPTFATATPSAAIFEDRTAIGNPRAMQTVVRLRKSGAAKLQQLVQRLQKVASDRDPRTALQGQLSEVARLQAQPGGTHADAQQLRYLETEMKKMRDVLQLGREPFDKFLKVYVAQADFLTAHSVVTQQGGSQ